MLAKGNRSRQVTEACKTYGGSTRLDRRPGSPARPDCITKSTYSNTPSSEWKRSGRSVRDFPAFIVVEDKGNDFFELVDKPFVGTPVSSAD